MGVGSSRPEEAQEAGDLVTWGPEEAAVVFTAYFEGTVTSSSGGRRRSASSTSSTAASTWA